MPEVALRELARMRNIAEPQEVVAELEFRIYNERDDTPLKFKVKVLRDQNNHYTGVPSHRIAGQVSLSTRPNVQTAVLDALNLVSQNYDPARPISEQFSSYEDY